jgi:siroheme synthase-like protein
VAYYPVFLDLRGRRALVVGGGTVALGKVAGLLRADAELTVVTPHAEEGIRRLAERGALRLEIRPYVASDMEGVDLAVAATDDPIVNQTVAADAARRNVLVNVVDDASRSRFIAPAVLERGDLQIAISTGGASPVLAVFLKDRLAACIGPEYGAALDLLRPLRQKLRELGWSMAERRDAIRALAEAGLVERVRTKDHAGIDELLERIFGRELSLESLGVRVE